MRVAKPSSETEPGPYRAPYWQPRRRHFSRRTSELGLTITDAADAGALTVINADPVDVADTCPDCSVPGVKRDHVRRQLVGAKLTRRVTRWILQRLAVDRMSVAATAKAPGVGWELVNSIAVTAAGDLVYADPAHLGRGTDTRCR